MPRTEKIDGDLTLDKTEGRCEQVQLAGFQLKSIERKTITKQGVVLKVNEAKFDDAMSVDILNDLTFTAVKASETETDIKKKMPGLEFILIAEIFVSGNVKRVAVFGKQV
jgi:hypothetical protein